MDFKACEEEINTARENINELTSLLKENVNLAMDITGSFIKKEIEMNRFRLLYYSKLLQFDSKNMDKSYLRLLKLIMEKLLNIQRELQRDFRKDMFLHDSDNKKKHIDSMLNHYELQYTFLTESLEKLTD
jgi:hypothetical protein